MSKENVISKKEPFARMVKRDHISVGKAWAIRLIAVALSLVVAALVIVAVTKQNPIEVYLGIIDGAVGSTPAKPSPQAARPVARSLPAQTARFPAR